MLKPVFVNHRHSMLTFLKIKGTAVEVGVETGRFSESILIRTSVDVLYSVDQWQNLDQLEITRDRLRPYGDRSVIVQETSVKAAQRFDDGFFDFVYIDADHRYEFVKKDLRAWWPKLKVGGIFAGHDYFQYKDFGVVEAVNEFAAQQHFSIHITNEHFAPSWFGFKPSNFVAAP